MRRPRCWMCGVTVPSRGLCLSCLKGTRGLCSRCSGRDECAGTYEAVSEARRQAGLDPPAYPPCTWMVPHRGTPSSLERTQLRLYGLPFVGIVALILAVEDAALDESDWKELLADGFKGQLRELASRWGARLREVA